ncbi:RNA polymerase sigma-70 factor (ECF subfamily) [Arcticibacter tournemirensis]|uniref:RNA polymerase sigma-70 factor n=1 Tax=Arcticibacter tournemirensis TaxID=699437 RepID=A0A5M9HMN5_9SPHI|nr:RNA polymerase sigma-70 factor [Arcticibacter tournemirensis]KAA8486277.1 RNA polymerase sigma-70 factor [Arcticibacter tournemirensis]TQM52082.1 RNA polymerase sigma-70 factor (ECF subfamily) [Arcticibacter tournemirensis]
MPLYMPSNWTDEKLLELTREDNRAAFTELYERYWKKLFVIAANKLKDIAVAEELTQDILADVWQRRDTIRITTTFSAYLAVAMKYKVIDYLARQSHRNRYEEYMLTNGTKYDDSTENWLSFEELRGRLEKLVNALPEKCRLIYQLSREQGYSNKRIAAEQSISEKTVEAHLTRALKILRSKLSSFLFSLFF